MPTNSDVLAATDHFYKSVQELRHERTPARFLQVVRAAQQLEQMQYCPVMIKWTAVQAISYTCLQTEGGQGAELPNSSNGNKHTQDLAQPAGTTGSNSGL